MKTIFNSQRLLSWKRVAGIASLAVALSAFSAAQTEEGPEQTGRVWEGYAVHESLEFGGRISSGFGGNRSMYNSLVNLQEGARLLDQSLTMRSFGKIELPFDSLDESMTGFGGDPNQVGRFRISKTKLYDLSIQYRHDQYYSDYNLLDNSLAVPNALNVNSFTTSPHFMNTRRSMGDLDLKVFPKSWVSFRFGYSRGQDQGPAYTSVHSPGDLIYLENYSTRSSRYRAGIDVKPWQRTQFSYDFIYEGDRNDTAGISDAHAIYQQANTGLLIDPGFTYDPNANLPSNCKFSSGNVVNSTCGGFLAYSRTQPIRTVLPTHQFSFTSSSIDRLDLSGSVSYTGGTAKNNAYTELYSRFSNPSYTQNGIYGSSVISQVTSNADFKATIHITPTWSFDEKFRWVNWRLPGAGILTGTATSTLTAATVLTPAALPNPTTESLYNNFFGEDSKYDTMQLNWTPSTKFGGFVGYKIGIREINDRAQTNTLTFATGVTAIGTPSAGSDKETEHHALIGFRVRPVESWQLKFDTDLMSSDGAYTAITPRHAQTFKIDSSYDVNRWATIDGAVSFDERSNDGYAQFPAAYAANGGKYEAHTRFYSLNASLHPTRMIDADFGWSFEQIYERAPECVPLTPGSANYGFSSYCTYTTGSARTNVYPLFSKYEENTNGGYALLVIKPIQRVRVNVGYDITSNSGSQNWLRADNGAVFQIPVDASGNAVVSTTQATAGYYNGLYPWQPLGTLGFDWHRPVAGVAVDLAKGITFKGNYNNYGYNEKGQQVSSVSARDFHGNLVTLALKYSF